MVPLLEDKDSVCSIRAKSSPQVILKSHEPQRSLVVLLRVAATVAAMLREVTRNGVIWRQRQEKRKKTLSRQGRLLKREMKSHIVLVCLLFHFPSCVHDCLVCMRACASWACQPREARRGRLSPSNQSHRQLKGCCMGAGN